MKLDNEFTVGVPVGQAWDVLTDLELIAPCMPGAQLTGVTDGVYTGKVKIKVGPVSAEYSGTAQFTEKDDATYRAVIDARGRDSRGNGNATAVISAHLRADGDRTVVNVTTDLMIAGRIAQFGSGMIKEVSAKLLGQFVQCLEGRLGGDLPVAAGAVEQPATAPGIEPVPDAQRAPGAAGPAARTASEPAGASAAATGAAAAVPASAEPAPINLMSVAGGAISKRLVPLAIALVVVAVVSYLIVR
jgi:uncharacterized protein